jgi:hypothetical protein
MAVEAMVATMAITTLFQAARRMSSFCATTTNQSKLKCDHTVTSRLALKE